jgi:deazaflavin-dependent oxidoreductase (nitroreductase family)
MSNNREWNKEEWDERNRKVIEEFRANGGKVGNGQRPHVLLTTTGAKSGLTRVNPLNYSTDGERIIVIASKGGAATHPDWYYNLVAHPEVTVEVGLERFPARARIAQGEERERLFNAQAALMPYFAKYQQETKRQIPVVILDRIR